MKVRIHLSTLPLLLFASTLSGQVLTGRVLEEGTGAPVHAAFVKAVGGEGETVAAVLSDAAGLFRLRLPPGAEPVRLEVEALGHATHGFELEAGLAAGGDVGDIHLSLRPVTLPGLTARAEDLCRNRPGEGRATQLVWDEARKALEVASWALDQGLFRYRMVLWESELDEETRRVRSRSESRRTTLAPRPFTTLSPEELRADGYVRPDGDDLVAYAPDAEVLLSDAFLSNHCFGVVEDGAGRVGLAFHPNSRLARSEIAGTLWMHRDPLQPDYLEYRYVNVPDMDLDEEIGGEVHFRLLPTGAWVVDSWHVSSPVRARVSERTVAGTVEAVRVVGIHETGGDILAIVDRAGREIARRDGATLVGVVEDRLRGGPLPSALVAVVGTEYAVRTDGEGRFRMEGLPGGRYELSVDHPRLAEAGFLASSEEVVLADGYSVRVVLAVDSLVAIPGSGRRVVGQVVDGGDGRPVQGVAVVVAPAPARDGGRAGAGADRGVVLTDSAGRFSLPLVEGDGERLVLSTIAPGWVEPESREIVVPRGSHFQAVVPLSATPPLRNVSELDGCSEAPGASGEPGRARLNVIWREVGDVIRMVLAVPEHSRSRFDFQEAEVESVATEERTETITLKSLRRDTGVPLPASMATTLLRDGFRERTAEGNVYHPMDVRIFLEDGFRERHCLTLRRSAGDRSVLRLGFEPRVTGPRDRIDVAGEFLIDAGSGLPRGVVYGYVGEAIASQPMESAAGTMAFDRLPDGSWILSGWSRRLPVVASSRSVARADAVVGEWLPVPADFGIEMWYDASRFNRRLLSRVRSRVAPSEGGPSRDAPMFQTAGAVEEARGEDGARLWSLDDEPSPLRTLLRFTPVRPAGTGRTGADAAVSVDPGWYPRTGEGAGSCAPTIHLDGEPRPDMAWVGDWLPEQEEVVLRLLRERSEACGSLLVGSM